MNYKHEPMRIDERNAVEIYGAYKFVKLLSTPWKEWEAFELGLIDEKGDKIRKAKTNEEKKAFGLFEIVVRNIKQLIERLPFGKTRVASYAAALFLMREHKSLDNLDAFILEIQSQLGSSIEESKTIVAGRYTINTKLFEDIVDTSGFVQVESVNPIQICGMNFYTVKDNITRTTFIVSETMLEKL